MSYHTESASLATAKCFPESSNIMSRQIICRYSSNGASYGFLTCILSDWEIFELAASEDRRLSVCTHQVQAVEVLLLTQRGPSFQIISSELSDNHLHDIFYTQVCTLSEDVKIPMINRLIIGNSGNI